ncbi:glutamate--tRNA ligase [Limnochorda pilosa]|uniref:Glutamate--tRNA ligase n=1 Tax=Limnochorda pilosa TaxID=1555112 RepID=A0A0K2SJI8_LIMPI|nr:glutamate--tRNA ligase [Limnochorda pilosa]BAS27276.1 glutamyl-tRNA synthetase [Limnochorda pilosa]
MEEVRARFAPSPTGYLHVGGARTALFNWLFARHHGGTFVLRIEDTDALRSTEASVNVILEALHWLGLDWDEGPSVGGPYGPYRQTERLDLYREYARRLADAGRAYRCYCSSEELNERRQALLKSGQAVKYDRKCLNLSKAERDRYEAEGRVPVLRFLADDQGETVVEDLIRGSVRFENHVLDDFVIIKSDGNPTYNFAVVVDDALMRITHVIRGEDHLSNTPRQIQVYQALDLPVPRFAHVPMILGPDRQRLSKRHGATSVEQYREQGYLPEAMVNYLALLGWSLDDRHELFTREELVEHFSLERISKNPAIFDVKKIDWMNGVYLRSLPRERLAREAAARLEQAGYLPPDQREASLPRLEAILEQVQARIKHLGELVPWTYYYFTDEVQYDEKAVERFLTPEYVPAMLAEAVHGLEALESFTVEGIQAVFEGLRERRGMKLGDVLQPVRVALTGTTVSPGMYEVIHLLGRDAACRRLRRWAKSSS